MAESHTSNALPTEDTKKGTATTGTAATAQNPNIAAVLPAEHWAEAPENSSDTDSALGASLHDSTTSLTSSILKYRTINGRTYHSDVGNAQYWGTNDDGHNQSMDLWHHMITLCLGDKLYAAPVENPKTILDVGTGTGIWAIDMADMFPDAEVTGTDVSPIQPTWLPPNCQFAIEDCTQPWTFHENQFDFVHIRSLGGSIADWSALFREAYRCTKPGGWAQSLEMSVVVHSEEGPLDPKSAVTQWTPLFIEGGKKIGRSFTVVEDEVQEKSFSEAGFVDIQKKEIKLPCGSWSEDPREKETGLIAQVSVLNDIEGFILFLTTAMGWPQERVMVYAAHLRKELLTGKQKVYTKPKVVWARKPETT